MKRILYRSLIIIGSMIVGACLVLLSEVLFLNSHAPAGPAHAKGMAGHYYNWVYSYSRCPSAPLERYENEDLSFLHFSYKDAPDMQRHRPAYNENKHLAVSSLHYAQETPYAAGNVDIEVYKPKGRTPAGPEELKAFVWKYAEENVGLKPEMNYGYVTGAPFSAYFTSGSREGLCFTDVRGGLYCFCDQDMAMQRGADPFIPTILYAFGIGAYSLEDYPTFGLKDWLTRPSREKCSECNFVEIKRTIMVKGKK